MRWLSTIVALCASVAVASAFSVTPNVAVGIGGAADDVVMGVAGDAAGSYYAVGWTTSALLNSSFTAGGPTATTYYGMTYARSGEAKNGFITKYSKYGVPQWSAYVGGVNDQTINAVAVSQTQTIVVVCGSYNGSDAYIGHSLVNVTTLTASQRTDVFVAAFDASTGALLWRFAAASNLDDQCVTIAERNGQVVYGGSAFAGPGTASGNISPQGVVSNVVSSIATGSPSPFIGICNTADGAVSSRFISSPGRAHNSGENGVYPGAVGAVTFDSVGNLWVATSVEYQTFQRAPHSVNEVVGTHDVQVIMYPAYALQDSNVFENGSPNLPVCSGAFDPSVLDPTCVAYPGTVPYAQAQISVFGSDGDDIVTGISVQNAAGDMTANMTANFSRVVLSGYTVGATPASTFKLHQYIELTDPTAFAANSPASAFDFALPNSGEVGWWVAQKGSFNAESGPAFYAKVLPSGLSGRINSVACDANSKHCVLAASLQGSANLTVGPTLRAVASAGSRDAFVMRVDAAGNIAWLEQTGGAGNDSANAVVLFAGAGLARPGQWAAVGGFFSGAGVGVASYSASPITVPGRGGADGLLASYDDVDDCGLDPTPGSFQPYGPNACGVVQGNLNALGGSLCIDEPGFPLCFCHMNVTGASPGTFCNRRGWDCSFMAQYYFGLLDMCDCPAAQNPHANPLLDVAGRLQSCAGNVCQFGALTGEHANCLPLVLDLMNTCGASPITPAADKVYISLFRQFYDGCNTGGASSTAADCTGFDFCAAPRAAAPASAVVTAVATAAAAILIAVNVRRS